jgi:ribonucleoside-diphosphate reductase alpha chain
MKAPAKAITTGVMTAIDQLELWKTYQMHWAEHKPSMTVYIRESEWMDVGAWVYRNFDLVSGVAFLPASGHSYKQSPYEEISEAEYNKALEAMPKGVDWAKLKELERDDSLLSANRELACTGEKCDVTADVPTAEENGNGK